MEFAKTKYAINVTYNRHDNDTEMAKGEGLFWVMPVEKAVRQIFQAIIDKKKVAYVTRRWGLIATILKQIPRPIYDRM